MEKELIDLLFLSRKRKDLLMLLKDGDRNIDEIKSLLPFKPTALLPQLKKLKDEELVLHEGKNYRLSMIGKILVEKMEPLLDILDVIEENEEFWQERNLEEVPISLLHRLNELKPYTLVEPNSNNIFDLPKVFIENLSKSKQIFSMLTYFHPQFPSILLDNRNEDTEITLIVTETLFKRVKKDFKKELDHFFVQKKRKLFVCDDSIKIAMITSTERFMFAGFFGQNNTFDQKNILSFEPAALRWAGDLLLHYKKDAREIPEI